MSAHSTEPCPRCPMTSGRKYSLVAEQKCSNHAGASSCDAPACCFLGRLLSHIRRIEGFVWCKSNFLIAKKTSLDRKKWSVKCKKRKTGCLGGAFCPSVPMWWRAAEEKGGRECRGLGERKRRLAAALLLDGLRLLTVGAKILRFMT